MVARLWLVAVMVSTAAVGSGVGGEGVQSDLLIQIGHISQPYNCTLFLDNLEVRIDLCGRNKISFLQRGSQTAHRSYAPLKDKI